MAFLIYFLCTALIQLTTGQFSTLNGQGISTQRPHLSNALSSAKSMTSNTPTRGLGVTPATKPLARNVAINNGLANGNIANTNAIAACSNIPRANNGPSLLNTNLASQTLANNLVNANTAAATLDASSIVKPNFGNAANLFSSGVTNQLNPSNIAKPILSGNIASSLASSKFQLGSPYPQNYGSTYANVNSASNLASGNVASASRANLGKGRYSNAVSSNSYSQSVLNGPPGNQQYGIHVQADALEIAGNVAVTGSLPLYGTVGLNGRLPTGGAGTVNYACSR